MRARVLVLALAMVACNQTEGDALIECRSVDEAGWPGCADLDPQFSFDADFFALQREGDVVEIRIQQTGQGADIADGFQIQVFRLAELTSCEGDQHCCEHRDISLGAPDLEAINAATYPACRSEYAGSCSSPDSCPLVRMVAHFPRHCSLSAPPLMAGDPSPLPDSARASVINFEHLVATPGSQVTGSFDVNIVDGRTRRILGRCNTPPGAPFTFVVKEGQPYVRFVE